MDFSSLLGLTPWAGVIYLLRSKVNHRTHGSLERRLERIESRLDNIMDHMNIHRDEISKDP